MANEKQSYPPEDLAAITFSRYNDYVNPGFAALVKFLGLDAVEVSAQGCYVTASDGQRYLDCLGGPGVFTMGHRHPRVVEAVHKQLERMPLSSHTLLNPLQAELAERLADVTPGELQYSFLGNSGAEAVEGALKVARASSGRPKFVAAQGGFHGKTFGALSASGREAYRQPFYPLLPEFVHVPFGDEDALAQAVDQNTAAVILEPVQCEAGIIIPPEGYLQAARRICDGAEALLILDEIQTGLGRTGKMFACDWDNVCPDIMTLGKALGGGVMPVGVFIARPAIWEVFKENPLIHSSTFGGNPLACVAARTALEVIEEENLVERASERGAQLAAGVREVAADYPQMVTEVRDKGLLVGLEFTDSDIGGLIIAGLVQRQILTGFALNDPKVVRFEPPAIITADQIEHVVAALQEALEQTAELLQLQ